MFAALNEQDLLCRVFGDCLVGDPLDREVGSPIGSVGPLAKGTKLFTYLRYNAELTAGGLAAIGCGDLRPERVQKLDAADAIPDLSRVGLAVAQQKVRVERFSRFPALNLGNAIELEV
jgi:uncharacterized protein